MNDGVEQQAYGIDKNVPLLALDLSATSSLSLLARIIPLRINTRPLRLTRLRAQLTRYKSLFEDDASHRQFD
jgi:hypothetical protein